MARLPRLYLPGGLYLLTQRGHNGQAVFQDEQDYARMYTLLKTHCLDSGVALYAYVLMPAHMQFLLQAQDAQTVPRFMQALGRCYAQYFNQRYACSGSLWDGRYRSALLQAEKYVLPAMVFLDSAPVLAGLCQNAADYAWSSHAHCIGLRRDSLLRVCSAYWDLGNTPFAREATYRAQVQQGLGPCLQEQLRQASYKDWAVGDAGFLQRVEHGTGRRATAAKPGRPRRESPTQDSAS